MNNNPNNKKKTEYKIRHSNLTKEEAKKGVVRRPAPQNGQNGASSGKGPAQAQNIRSASNANAASGRRSPSQSMGAARSQARRDPDSHSQTAASQQRSRERYHTPTPPPAPTDNRVELSGSSDKASEEKKKSKTRKNDFIKPTDIVRIRGGYDRILLVLVIVLTLFGLIMDFSASYAFAYSKYGDSFYFVKRQAIFAVLGLCAMFFAMHFDYRWLRKVTVPIFAVTLALLVAVLLYGVASGVAQRWINIGDIITIQPSEIMKFSLVTLLALYVARNQDRITNYRNKRQSNIYGIFIPFAIIAVCCVLILLEKHFSGTIIVFAIGMIVIFAGGAKIRWFVGLGGGALAAIIPLIMLVPYARGRVDMFFHPENYKITDKIWQTMQGLYAVGSGGLFGVGLGNSRQKQLYVSQPQNDFVFSIIAEELGFAGAVLVIILFMLLIWRGFTIALKAPDTFSSLVVIGLIGKVALQAILNIAVVTNSIPNTGISLPFFSYGGTALLMQLGEMGIVLSISRYSYQKNHE